MQIRAGNRQDEATVRTLVFQALEEIGIQPDLEGRDKDLRNIERNYFWYDGLCLVAERDSKIIGFLAGRRREGQEQILELSRFLIVPEARRQGVARALVNTCKAFADQSGYQLIELACIGTTEDDANHVDPEPLQKLGFSKSPDSRWQIQVENRTF